jgi:hypothetical protein
MRREDVEGPVVDKLLQRLLRLEKDAHHGLPLVAGERVPHEPA